MQDISFSDTISVWNWMNRSSSQVIFERIDIDASTFLFFQFKKKYHDSFKKTLSTAGQTVSTSFRNKRVYILSEERGDVPVTKQYSSLQIALCSVLTQGAVYKQNYIWELLEKNQARKFLRFRLLKLLPERSKRWLNSYRPGWKVSLVVAVFSYSKETLHIPQ